MNSASGHLLPFPDMPYSAAPMWSFAIAECSLLLLLVICACHAMWKGRQGALSYLLGGFSFGLVLEYVEVLSHSYTYGPFFWMIGHQPLNIPVCIGAGWGIILYSSRLFSDRFGLPLTAAAALDTLLALNIDLSMDVVAYRLHMWHWDWTGTSLPPLRAQWFGVPYGNFVGWATVVFCYSAFSRLFARKVDMESAAPEERQERRQYIGLAKAYGRSLAVACLALLCSQVVLFMLEAWIWSFLQRYLGLTSGLRLLLIVTSMLMLIGQRWRHRVSVRGGLSRLAVLVPCWFHFYFLFCLLWFHFYRESASIWLCCINSVGHSLALALLA